MYEGTDGIGGNDADPRARIAAMPKVELHLHLEGSLRPATMLTLAGRNGIDLGADDPAGLGHLYDVADFGRFAQLFRTGLDVLRTEVDFRDAVVALARELAAQHVRYAEVTTTPWQHTSRAIPLEVYTAGLDEGRRIARRDHGVALSWVCDITRESEAPASTAVADLLTGPNPPEGAIGIGLGGVEVGFPPELFAESFARVRAVGLASLPHAGEQDGPAAIRAALDALGADRIGHGIRSVDDPVLLAELVERRVPLEVCPSSNVTLGLAPSWAEHPVRRLLDAGAAVTINTDDPAFFGVTLTDELTLLHDVVGVGVDDIAALQRRALDVSFAPDDVRAAVVAELTEVGAPAA